MEKLIITAAICGAEVTKKHNPRGALHRGGDGAGGQERF